MTYVRPMFDRCLPKPMLAFHPAVPARLIIVRAHEAPGGTASHGDMLCFVCGPMRACWDHRVAARNWADTACLAMPMSHVFRDFLHKLCVHQRHKAKTPKRQLPHRNGQPRLKENPPWRACHYVEHSEGAERNIGLGDKQTRPHARTRR